MVFVCLKKGPNFEKSAKNFEILKHLLFWKQNVWKSTFLHFFFYKSSMKIELSRKTFFEQNCCKLLFHFALQVSVTHDDVFGDYKCEAHNKMGRISRLVKLSEGAKAGIPLMEINKINTESVIMTILVRKINYFFSSKWFYNFGQVW